MGTHNDHIGHDHDQPLRPIRLRVLGDVVYQETSTKNARQLKDIYRMDHSPLVRNCFIPRSGIFHSPKSNENGFPKIHATRTIKGIQNKRNCTDKSIDRPCAMPSGTGGFRRKRVLIKYTVTIMASAANDVSGRRMRPSHLWNPVK